MREESYRYPWQKTYIEELGLRRVLIGDPKLNIALPALVFPETLTTLEQWRREGNPITINTVVVSPNSGTPTLRVLTYLHEALMVAVALRKLGFQVDSLRIINPCYLNVLCNGGNLGYQKRSGIVLAENLRRWITNYHELQTNFEIDLDQGAEIDENMLPQLIEFARKFALALDPDIFQQFVEKWQRHRYDSDGQETTNLDPEDATSLYILAHPEAWQYYESTEGQLFGFRPRAGCVLNYMPQSELPFVDAMIRAGVQVRQDDKVGTAFSIKHISPPYYPLRPDEPCLPSGWWWRKFKVKYLVNYLQNLMTELRRSSGSHSVAEMLDCLGDFRASLQERCR